MNATKAHFSAMSDPRQYYHSSGNSGSGRQYPPSQSSSNSLSAAGMSNIYYPTNQPSYGAALPSGQMHPATTGYRVNPTNYPQSHPQLPYQQNNANYSGSQADPYGFMNTASPNYRSQNQMPYLTMPMNNNTGWASAPDNQYPESHSRNSQPSSHWPSASQPPVQPFSQESWNDMLMSSLANPDAANPVSPYGPSAGGNYAYPSTAGPSAGNPYSGGQSHPASATPGSRRSGQSAVSVKQCYHCHATSTPLWRRDPVTYETLCNACGLYLQQRHSMRPQELIDADEGGHESGASSDGHGDGPECSNCHTRQTSVWRRNKAGDQVCNACGVYARLNGKERPPSLRRNKIRPRAKQSQG